MHEAPCLNGTSSTYSAYGTPLLPVAGIGAKLSDVCQRMTAIVDIRLMFEAIQRYMAELEKKRALSIMLDEFANLEADWDGYGASPIEVTALKNARVIWLHLAAAGLSVPDATPNAKGTVSFEWESEKGWAHLESGNKTFAFYVAAKDASPISRSRCLPDRETCLLDAVDAIRQIL